MTPLSRSDPALRFVRSRQGFVRRCHGTEKVSTIIALSRNASCLHLPFNYSQSAFFGQGQPGLVYLRQRFVRWSQAPRDGGSGLAPDLFSI